MDPTMDDGKHLEHASQQVTLYQETRDEATLNKAFDFYQQALHETTTLPMDEQHLLVASKIIDCYQQRALEAQCISDIDRALQLCKQILEKPPGYLTLGYPFLSRCSKTRYSLTGRRSDLDRVIACDTAAYAIAVQHKPPYFPHFSLMPMENDRTAFTLMKDLGDNYGLRYDRYGQIEDLIGAVLWYREVRRIRPEELATDALQAVLDGLEKRLTALSELSGQRGNAVAAEAYRQDVLKVHEVTNTDENKDTSRDFEEFSRAQSGVRVWSRHWYTWLPSDELQIFKHFENPNFRDEETEEIVDPSNYTYGVEKKARRGKDSPAVDLPHWRFSAWPDDAEPKYDPKGSDSIDLLGVEECLDSVPKGHTERGRYLRDIGYAIVSCFKSLGRDLSINNAVKAAEERLQLYPEDDALYFDACRGLCIALSVRGTSTANVVELSKAVALAENALRFTRAGNKYHVQALSNLSATLAARFRLTGEASDINKAVDIAENILLCRQDDGAPFQAFYFLFCTLNDRFHEYKDVADIHRMVGLLHQMHPFRKSISLETDEPKPGDVCSALQSHYILTDGSDPFVIDEALQVAFIALAEKEHPPRLDNDCAKEAIAVALVMEIRFRKSKSIVDMDQVASMMENVAERAKQRADVINALWVRSRTLQYRFELTRDPSNLDEAIEAGLEALHRKPTKEEVRVPLLDYLSSLLEKRFTRSGAAADFEGAVRHREEMVSLRPVGHAERAKALHQLATLLAGQLKPSSENFDGEVAKVIALYQEAAGDPYSPELDRLSYALDWTDIAKLRKHASLMEAQTMTVLILEKVVALASSLEAQYLALLGNSHIWRARQVAVDAAARAFAEGRLELGVRLLEQGRNVVFRQLEQLRIQLDDIHFVAPELAKRFRSISRTLEDLAVAKSSNQIKRNVGGSEAFEAKSDSRLSRKYASASKEWSSVVGRIRGINGFQSFLHPPLFPELRWAAEAGPLIIVNISAIQSSAIVIARHIDQPILVPLHEATTDQVKRLADAFTSGAKVLDQHGTIELLRKLWSMMVEPIADTLQKPPINLKQGSRIWWCATGHAARLPLHGAGPYRRGEKDMVHLYTSSYTPNLAALIRARRLRPSPSPPSGISPSVLLVGQAETTGERALPNTVAELRCITTFAGKGQILEGVWASRGDVLAGLQRHPWVHLACHGHRDASQPFASHFSLHDGPLSLLDLIRTELPNAELAVLSACHSAGGNEDLPDEFLHPAAGMLVAGFRSVVATLWALDDSVGPIFAEEFYKEMLGQPDGPKDASHAAIATKKAVAALGRMAEQQKKAMTEKGKGKSVDEKSASPARKNLSLMQRINFVHFGI